MLEEAELGVGPSVPLPTAHLPGLLRRWPTEGSEIPAASAR